MIGARTDRISVRFIPHKYDNGSGWLGIESTDGKVLPRATDSFFRLDLQGGMGFEDAVRLAAFLNAQIAAFGQTQLLAPGGDAPM
jgi:hypothetical protein